MKQPLLAMINQAEESMNFARVSERASNTFPATS